MKKVELKKVAFAAGGGAAARIIQRGMASVMPTGGDLVGIAAPAILGYVLAGNAKTEALGFGMIGAAGAGLGDKAADMVGLPMNGLNTMRGRSLANKTKALQQIMKLQRGGGGARPAFAREHSGRPAPRFNRAEEPQGYLLKDDLSNLVQQESCNC